MSCSISLSRIQRDAHAVLDVVVDDEVQFFFREAVVLRQQLINLVDDGLGELYADLKLKIISFRLPVIKLYKLRRWLENHYVVEH